MRFATHLFIDLTGNQSNRLETEAHNSKGNSVMSKSKYELFCASLSPAMKDFSFVKSLIYMTQHVATFGTSFQHHLENTQNDRFDKAIIMAALHHCFRMLCAQPVSKESGKSHPVKGCHRALWRET